MANDRAYILIPDDVPTGFAVNGAAHAGCCMALKWGDDPAFRDWARNSFRKVTCKFDILDLLKFEAALIDSAGLEWMQLGESLAWLDEQRIIITESDWGGGVVAVVFKPRVKWPKVFRKLELYQ